MPRCSLLVAFTLGICLSHGPGALGQAGAVQGHPARDSQAVKPTGPAAQKADALLHNYTARMEKEIEQSRGEVERLRSELHELIDLRFEMEAAIAEMRADLAAKGVYSAEPVVREWPADQEKKQPEQRPRMTQLTWQHDLFYGLGSALPKEPTAQEKEQLRRLAPRAELKKLAQRLRIEVEQTRTEVDELAYKLLELRQGIPNSRDGFGGGMMGMGGMNREWFGSMASPGGMM